MIEKPTRSDSIRVWSGFRRPAMAHPDFLAALGDTFVPGTLTMLKPLGISAYIVSVLIDDNPDLPGESALVVYSSPDHYRAVTRDNLRGRVHRASHFAVFDMERSRAVFPTRWDPANLAMDTFFAYPNDVDWQASRVFFQIIARAGGAAIDVGALVRAGFGVLKGNLDGLKCSQAILVLRDSFATLWTAFPPAHAPATSAVEGALKNNLPAGLALHRTLPAETLACYGEDAELMTVRKDAAIQFRFFRGPATDLF